MNIVINHQNNMYLECLRDGEMYKILTGLPGSVYLLGLPTAQYFKNPHNRPITIAQLRNVFPDIRAVEESAQLYTGGTIDIEKLILSVEELIKKGELKQKDKNFLIMLAQNHDKNLPDAFGYLLSQSGYDRYLDRIKFKVRDPRFKLSCEVFNSILDEIPMIIKKTRLEGLHGSKIR